MGIRACHSIFKTYNTRKSITTIKKNEMHNRMIKKSPKKIARAPNFLLQEHSQTYKL